MDEESVGATVFATWQYFFYKTLLTEFVDDKMVRLTLASNYPFIDFFQIMVIALIEEPSSVRYNKLCKGAYPEYKGDRHCAYNMAKAMAQTNQFLINEVSPNSIDWKWKNVHVNEYANMPWSLTPFKTLFHRETSIGGNQNTVKVSKYSLKRLDTQKSFKSSHTPNFKTVVSFGDTPKDQKILFSFDGGQSGNIFAGHYFDFNQKHSNGHLLEGYTGKAALEQAQQGYTKLELKPLS